MIDLFENVPLLLALFLILFMLILMGWISKKPVRGLYLTFFSTSILLAPHLPIVRNKVTATEVMIMLTWVAILVHMGQGSIRTIQVTRNQRYSIFLAGIFIVWIFVSFTFNNVTFGSGFADSAVEMLNFFYGYLMFVTVVVMVDDWQKWHGCLLAWLAGAGVVSVFGFLVILGYGPSWGYDDYSGRISSTLRFENQVPSFLLPISVALVFMIVKRGITAQKRLIFIILMIGLILTTIGTGSRTSLIMMLVSFMGVIFIAVREGKYRAYNKGMLFNLILWMIAGFTVYVSLALLNYEGDYTLGKTPPWQRPVVLFYDWIEGDRQFDSTRPKQLAFVRDSLAEHILIGTGPKLSGKIYNIAEIHNTYAAILLETGLIGLVLFLWWIFGVVRSGWSTGIRITDPYQRLLVLSMVAGMALLLIYNMAMFGLRQRNIWLLAGLLIAASSILKRQQAESDL